MLRFNIEAIEQLTMISQKTDHPDREQRYSIYTPKEGKRLGSIQMVSFITISRYVWPPGGGVECF